MQNNQAESPTRILELQTRFLYPFFFEPDALERASALLQECVLLGKSGVWHCGKRDDVFEEETLAHVSRFLFPHDNGAARCNYLAVENDTPNRIFGTGLVLELLHDHTLTLQREEIEVFLNAHGVGVLSITLKLVGSEFTTEDATAFNYRLVQPRQKSPHGLRLPHPAHEPEQFQKMPTEQRKELPPVDGAPLAERLGVRGGRFWLVELAQALLQPMTAVGLQPALSADLVQAQFWVYSVARFDESVDWNDGATRKKFAQFLSALAQVEEPGHAGAVGDDLGVANAVLNTKHWAAVGLMGAVHLLANQRDNHPFNSARVGRAMRKYFVPHLMALLQRLMLQRAMSEASALVKSPDAAAKLAALRQSLLEFGIGGHFGQVSSRHAVQRFFAIAEEGLGVNGAWQEVRQAIEDLDAKFTAEETRKLAQETKALAEGQKRAIEELVQLQSMVHLIEVFIVSVYTAELWHFFAAENEWLKDHHLVSVGVVVFAILGAAGAWFLLKPWKHTHKRDH
jgi:hypothetical protein